MVATRTLLRCTRRSTFDAPCKLFLFLFLVVWKLVVFWRAEQNNATIISLLSSLLSLLSRYEHNHQEKMGTRSLSQLLGNTLYYRRFFPYYAFNILAGLDEEGKGAVYGYDAVGKFLFLFFLIKIISLSLGLSLPVSISPFVCLLLTLFFFFDCFSPPPSLSFPLLSGSFQRQPDGISANGSAMKLIMPLLDNIVGFKNRSDGDRRVYTAEEAVELVKEGFVTAGERDINCGDAVEIKVITKDGITTEIFELKKD